MNEKKKKKTVIICICVIAAILIVAGFMFFIWFQNKQLHEPHFIEIQVELDDFDQDNSSRIPIEVKGKDLDNKEVNEVKYMSSKDGGFALCKGEYSLSFPASPLCKNGSIYACPGNTCDLKVEESLKAGEKCVVLAEQKFTYTKKNCLEVSDEEINVAYEYAKSDKNCPINADECKEATVKVRDDAVTAEKERIAKEEEEKRKAEEAAKNKVNSEDAAIKLAIEYYVGKGKTYGGDGYGAEVMGHNNGAYYVHLYYSKGPNYPDWNLADVIVYSDGRVEDNSEMSFRY
ncbi:MAG: hypothetical protein MJ189_00360 [Coriobacteriales bacterium]|nr:hypothetical protein [Coriobacteriales bacterium]